MRQLILLLLIFIPILVFSQQQVDTVTLYFNIDERALNSGHKKILDTLKVGEHDTVLILGFSDHLGQTHYNLRLSDERANHVRQYFLQKNLPVHQSMGKGVTGDKNVEPEKGDPTARRVEIIIARNAVELIEETRVSEEQIELTPKEPELLKVKVVEPEVYIAIIEKKEIFDGVTKGANIVLENLNFHPGSHRPLPESMPVLDDLLTLLKQNPDMRIRIEGHICCYHGRGDGFDVETGTNRLSRNRARFVYNYLIRNGINQRQVSYRGYGRRRPVVENEITEDDMAKNRRVEIRILRE